MRVALYMEKSKTFFNNSVKIEQINLSESDSSDSDTSTMSPIGFIEPYTDGMSIDEYLERFEAYLMLQKVADDKEKTVVLIGVSAALLYNKLKSVCAPSEPNGKRYSEIKPLLVNALKPKILEVVERAKFYSRNQSNGENATVYSLALRQLAQTCNFGDHLDSNLRDRFIMGLCNEEMKRLVIQANPATFEVAILLAQTNEISNNVGTSEHTGIYGFNTRGRFQPRGDNRSAYSHTNNRFAYNHTNNRTSYNQGHNSRTQEARGSGNRFVEQSRSGVSRGFGNRRILRNRYRPGRCYNCGSRNHYVG